ncbi:MAG: LysR family transcriptional regulator [Acidimicrobiia bacterium]|nr:LysR family transcriptional regulator [Acidimicrobiia bacterium]
MLELPQISIQQLAYLVAIDDEPSWAIAARRLHVTPSALSQGVGELERRLGMDLFTRDGRRRLPRPEAQPVFDYARSVIVQTEDLIRWVDTRRAGRSGRLRVGMIDVAAVHHFPQTIRAFTEERPDVLFDLVVAPSSELAARLAKGELDLAVVVETPTELPGLDSIRLLNEPMAVYRPPGTKSGAPATWGPFVGFPPSSHTRSLIAAELSELGAPFEVVAESHQPEVLLQMVRLGMGWTVLPVSQAEAGPEPLERARTEPLLYRNLTAVRRSDRLDHPAADAFLEMLRNAASSDTSGRG